MRILAIAAGLAFFATPAAAQFVNCADLEKTCSDSAVRPFWQCTSYAQGVMHGVAASQSPAPPPWCLPKPLTHEQVQKAVGQWLTAHPQYWSGAAASCTIQALIDSFPCSPKP